MALWEKESEGLITPVSFQPTPKCGSKEKCDTLLGAHPEEGLRLVWEVGGTNMEHSGHQKAHVNLDAPSSLFSCGQDPKNPSTVSLQGTVSLSPVSSVFYLRVRARVYSCPICSSRRKSSSMSCLCWEVIWTEARTHLREVLSFLSSLVLLFIYLFISIFPFFLSFECIHFLFLGWRWYGEVVWIYFTQGIGSVTLFSLLFFSSPIS